MKENLFYHSTFFQSNCQNIRPLIFFNNSYQGIYNMGWGDKDCNQGIYTKGRREKSCDQGIYTKGRRD